MIVVVESYHCNAVFIYTCIAKFVQCNNIITCHQQYVCSVLLLHYFNLLTIE